jgi:four helix bundle protein
VVWQKADELAYQVYLATKRFLDDERFGLVSQMRRASVSVAANIVEGYTHSTPRGRRRFYEIARGSLTELEYYIDFVYMRLKYIGEQEYELLSSLRQDVGRLLFGLFNSTRS